MARDVFERICALLYSHHVEYERLEHEHVHHSHEAAKIRGNKVEQAAKAIVLKERKEGRILMFVVGGDRKIDLRVVKKDILGVKNISLASPEEVLAATTCTIGSVPPFGNLFDIPVYFDKHLADTQEEIVFSAGTHNDSIRMKTKDYLSVVKPIVREYSVPIGTASAPSP